MDIFDYEIRHERLEPEFVSLDFFGSSLGLIHSKPKEIYKKKI